MSATEPVSDLDLNAYLDGELSADGRLRVQAWLAEHPRDADRLTQLGRVDAAIRSRYGALANEPLPPAMQELLSASRVPARSRDWLRIAAAILLLLAGGVAGYVLRGVGIDEPAGRAAFVDDALGAHVVYAAEVRHPVEVAANEEDHLVKWLTKRVGADIRAPLLAERQFRLMGGRLLAAEGAPAAQFMYENASGRRLTLYIRRSGARENTAFQFAKVKGLAAFYWIDRPLAYAIIAELPREELLGVARLVYEQLE